MRCVCSVIPYCSTTLFCHLFVVVLHRDIVLRLNLS